MARRTTTRKDLAAQMSPRSFTLGAWMAKLGVSDTELADRLGVRRESVWRYQTGERQPTKGMIEKIAKALGLTPADLFRSPGHVSLDEAARHITNEEQRARIAQFLRRLPPS